MTLHDYIEIAWRRLWWWAIPLALSLVVSLLLILFLPRTYRSSTLILVEAQKIPEEYVKSAVSGTIEDRLSTIRQQILSRSLLQKVINEFDLYREERKRLVAEEIIEQMRNDIEIKTVGTQKSIDAFTISYMGEKPQTVRDVANRLASFFIEESLKVREQLVEGATEFLENELKMLKETLEKQEVAVGAFKKRFMGGLPQQMEANLRALDRFQLELQSAMIALKTAEERKKTLEEATAAVPTAPLTRRAKLEQLRRELALLQKEYKDTYPEVIRLKGEIAAAEAEEESPGSPVNLEAGAAETEVARLRARQGELQRQIALYEKRVEGTPEREQQLMGLMRDYENTQKNYQSLLDKKLHAKISENLEKRQKGEQFRIIDPANLPEKPFAPNLMKVLAMGLLVGLGSGFGFVVLLEYLDLSFKKPEEIEEALGLPVLATIPKFISARREKTETVLEGYIHTSSG